MSSKITLEELKQKSEPEQRAVLSRLITKMPNGACAAGKAFLKKELHERGAEEVIRFLEDAHENYYSLSNLPPSHDKALRESKPDIYNRRIFFEKAGTILTILTAGVGIWRIADALEEIAKEMEIKELKTKDPEKYLKERAKLEIEYPDNSIENLGQGLSLVMVDALQFFYFLNQNNKDKVNELEHATEWLGRELSMGKRPKTKSDQIDRHQ